VQITGNHFVTGAVLTFENGTGGSAPAVSNLVVQGATLITATLTEKKGGPPRSRTWDVVVTNPDGGKGRLPGAFIVTP
jgi:hypothetical protein